MSVATADATAGRFASAATAAAGLLGVLVVLEQKVALVLAICACALGLLSAARAISGARLWITAFVVASATVNLPRLVSVGPTTGLGVIAALSVVTGLWVLVWRPDWMAAVPRLLIAYVLYLAVSLTFRPFTPPGGVTVLTALAFTVAVALGAGLGTRPQLERSFRTLQSGMMVALGVGFGAVAIGSAITTNQSSSDGVFSARPYAMLAVIALALGLSDSRRRGKILAGAAVVFAIYSLSRSDLAAMAVMLIVGARPPQGPVPWIKLATRVGLVLVIGLIAVQHYEPLRSRFYRGDIANVAGVRLNVEGRASLWGATWRRYTTSPLFGHGAGDADATAAAVDPTAGHPHNDYLRVLDDTGVVGLMLLLAGLASLGRKALSAARSDAGGSPLNLGGAALLALLGILVVMVFDNPLIYVFVTVPLGLLLGMATSEARRVSNKRRYVERSSSSHLAGEAAL